MKLVVINSGSKGNGYVLYNEFEALMIECGVRFADFIKACNGAMTKVCGCLVTHEHGDHAAYAEQVIRHAIPIFCSRGTAGKIKAKEHLIRIIEAEKWYNIGGFSIFPIRATHDAAEPFAYVIIHKDIGTLLFATDTGEIPYKIDGLSTIMIECNYEEKRLLKGVKTGEIDEARAERVRASHLSQEQSIGFVKSNYNDKLMRVVLIHASAENIDAISAKNAVYEAVHVPVYIAEKGISINIGKEPF